jgi:hypothetical protein
MNEGRFKGFKWFRGFKRFGWFKWFRGFKRFGWFKWFRRFKRFGCFLWFRGVRVIPGAEVRSGDSSLPAPKSAPPPFVVVIASTRLSI